MKAWAGEWAAPCVSPSISLTTSIDQSSLKLRRQCSRIMWCVKFLQPGIWWICAQPWNDSLRIVIFWSKPHTCCPLNFLCHVNWRTSSLKHYWLYVCISMVNAKHLVHSCGVTFFHTKKVLPSLIASWWMLRWLGKVLVRSEIFTERIVLWLGDS
jgi:hypothetical protein